MRGSLLVAVPIILGILSRGYQAADLRQVRPESTLGHLDRVPRQVQRAHTADAISARVDRLGRLAAGIAVSQ